MNGPSNGQPQRKQKLLERYLASLPDKRLRILNIKERIKAEGWQTPLVAELKLEIHRLAGSAGSYGFEDLGKQALSLDLTLAAGHETREKHRQILQLADHLLLALEGTTEDSK